MVIKFRGKSIFDGSWVYGLPRVRYGLNHALIEEENGAGHDVVKETVQQYTNMNDKEGKEIYFGDILKLDSWAELQQVVFVEGAFRLASLGKVNKNFTSDLHYIQHADIPQALVIGNITDNPELLVDN